MNTAALESSCQFADSEVIENVHRAFLECGYPGLRGLRCDYYDGVLTIRGHVGSYYLKQIAQCLAARVPGVTSVDNQLRVITRRASPQLA